MQTQYKAYTLGEALCSTLNLVILTINFDFNIIRSHRGLTNVQAISKAYSTEKSLLPYHVKVVYQYR